MDQQAVDKQIDQMVAFIRQEADEKAKEIIAKAQEDYDREKVG